MNNHNKCNTSNNNKIQIIIIMIIATERRKKRANKSTMLTSNGIWWKGRSLGWTNKIERNFVQYVRCFPFHCELYAFLFAPSWYIKRVVPPLSSLFVVVAVVVVGGVNESDGKNDNVDELRLLHKRQMNSVIAFQQI